MSAFLLPPWGGVSLSRRRFVTGLTAVMACISGDGAWSHQIIRSRRAACPFTVGEPENGRKLVT